MNLAELQQQQMQQPQGMPMQQGQPMDQDLQGLQDGGVEQQTMQMMTALAQNPTPELAQQLAQQLQSMGDPDSAQFAQLLMQVANDPQKIQELIGVFMQENEQE